MAGNNNDDSDDDDELHRLMLLNNNDDSNNSLSASHQRNGAQMFDIMEMLRQDLDANNNNHGSKKNHHNGDEVDLDFEKDLMAFLVPKNQNDDNGNNNDENGEIDEDVAPLKINWEDFLSEKREEYVNDDDDVDDGEDEETKTVREQGGELPMSSSSASTSNFALLEGMNPEARAAYESELAQKRKTMKILDELEELDDKALAEKRQQEEIMRAKSAGAITAAEELKKRMENMYSKQQ